MIVLAEPDPSDMVRAIQKAVTMLPNIDPQVMHNRVSLWFEFPFLLLSVGKQVTLFIFCRWGNSTAGMMLLEGPKLYMIVPWSAQIKIYLNLFHGTHCHNHSPFWFYQQLVGTSKYQWLLVLMLVVSVLLDTSPVEHGQGRSSVVLWCLVFCYGIYWNYLRYILVFLNVL